MLKLFLCEPTKAMTLFHQQETDESDEEISATLQEHSPGKRTLACSSSSNCSANTSSQKSATQCQPFELQEENAIQNDIPSEEVKPEEVSPVFQEEVSPVDSAIVVPNESFSSVEMSQSVDENTKPHLDVGSSATSLCDSPNTSFEDENDPKHFGYDLPPSSEFSAVRNDNANYMRSLTTKPLIEYTRVENGFEAVNDKRQTKYKLTASYFDMYPNQDELMSHPRAVHSPVNKSSTSSTITRNFIKPENRVLDSGLQVSTNYNTTHSWKTQAKMNPGGKDGSSVVTVPCDGKANLLGCKSAPLVSPLPPGVLEEPIGGHTATKTGNIRGQLLDFLEERGSSLLADEKTLNNRVRNQFLGFLQEQQIKNRELRISMEELEVLAESTSQGEDDGVIMYEEDSNDGMDRKLQEFDDDEDEEIIAEHTNIDRIEDTLNGNAVINQGQRNLHTITEQSGDDATPDFPTDVSSDDNAYNEVDNRNDSNNAKNNTISYHNKDASRSYNPKEKEFTKNKRIKSSKNNQSKVDSSVAENREGRRQGTAGNVAWIVDGGGGIGATGTVFHLRLVGSVEVSEESSPSAADKSSSTSAAANSSKRPRKEMVTEAVSKLKVRSMSQV